MGDPSLLDQIKDWITGISFRVFLWSIGLTDDQYWEQVYEIEKARRESEGE